MIPITIPAERELNPAISGMNFCRNGVTTINAKKPYTTVGTAAKTSSKGLTICFIFLGAYSLKYIAIVSPAGRDTLIAIIVVNNVPIIRGRIPKCWLAKRGVHCVSVKKSIIDTSLKKFTLSLTKTIIQE